LIIRGFFKKSYEILTFGYKKPKSLYIKYVLILKYIVGDKMEVAITKMSENGQVVIPAEIRKDAGIKPSTKFIVFNEGGNIMLKQIKKEALRDDMLLIEKIKGSEEQIKEGKFVKADISMADEEIDDLLMA